MSDPQVVLITGASSGIGRAAARAFAREHARLILASRSNSALKATAAQCIADGGAVLTLVTDVGEVASVDALFAAALAQFGRIDVVVNAAAAVAYGRFDTVPAAVFERVLKTNLVGTANVARAALRTFAAQGGGSLILLGSLLGKIAVPLMSPYVTSKWGVQGLARMIQIEARQLPGVRVTVVSPGSVNTPAYSQAGNYTGWQGRPPPPVDRPEKVARAILRAATKPRRDRSVGVANGLVVLGFRLVPGVYDRIVTPLVNVGALSRTPIEDGPGSVFTPRPSGDSEYGSWGRHWLRGVAVGAAAAGALAAAGRRAMNSHRR